MFAIVGVSYRTAPIEVREKVSLSTEELGECLAMLRAHPAVEEVAVVSTCNRVDIMLSGAEDAEAISEAACAFFVGREPRSASHLYRYQGSAAIRHLFRLACSLDSMVVGEPQILGQLKQAVEFARVEGHVAADLSRITDFAYRTAKRVRTETNLGSGQVSVPTVGVDLARQIFGKLKGKKVALVGAGDMGQSVAKLLAQEGATLILCGRTPAKLVELQAELGGTIRTMDAIGDVVCEVDVLVTATSAKEPIITRKHIETAQSKRRGQPLFLIDLAVPRDIEPSIDDLESVFLYNVDDLARVVADSLKARKDEAERAETIVDESLEQYERTRSMDLVRPTIASLNRFFCDVMHSELDKSLRGKLKSIDEAEIAALRLMMDAAAKKLLHRASQEMREAVQEGDESSMELLRSMARLFPIENYPSSGQSLNPDPLTVPANHDTVGELARGTSATSEAPTTGLDSSSPLRAPKYHV